MSAPDKIYAAVLNGHVTMAWSDWREDKTDIECIRAHIHEAQIEALKAENAELTSALGVIHELAHNESTGPVFEDGYWAIRALAGEALGVK